MQLKLKTKNKKVSEHKKLFSLILEKRGQWEMRKWKKKSKRWGLRKVVGVVLSR